MNEITIRNLDHASVQRLRQLAWQDGRPLEEMVRSLLLAAPELQRSEAPHMMRDANARTDIFPLPSRGRLCTKA